MYSIGEFSKIAGLSVKALRLYHEKGLLVPTNVDPTSGYRYYDGGKLDRARAIAQLKSMTFSLDEIKEIIADCDDDSDVIGYLETKASDITRKMSHLRHIAMSIETIVDNERQATRLLQENHFEIIEKELPDILIASIRWKGQYSNIGKYFGKLYRAVGRNVCGKPLGLYHDDGYKEADADIEACVPIRNDKKGKGVSIATLKGGLGICLVHKGPYSDIGRSYEQIFAYAKGKGYVLQTPSRETYNKGPGMIFKGNPKNYLTEIVFMVSQTD